MKNLNASLSGKRAKHGGIKFGPKFKPNKFRRAEAMQRKNADETLAAIGQIYGVSKSTISRLSRTANINPQSAALLTTTYKRSKEAAERSRNCCCECIATVENGERLRDGFLRHQPHHRRRRH